MADYPEDRGSPAARILNAFTGLARHHLINQHGHLAQPFPPELNDLQRQILDRLGIPETAYLTT